MRTQVADTSRDAYHALGPKLGRQQRQVLAYLAQHTYRDHTRGEIARGTCMRLSSVCGRVNELLALQAIVEGVRRPCRVTNIAAHPLRLA